MISPHKDQWRGAFMFSLIFAWTNSWVNNIDAGDLTRYRAHYNVIAMRKLLNQINANIFDYTVKNILLNKTQLGIWVRKTYFVHIFLFFGVDFMNMMRYWLTSYVHFMECIFTRIGTDFGDRDTQTLASYKIRKISGCACAGNAGNGLVTPTRITARAWRTWRGKHSRHSRCRHNPQFYVSGKWPTKRGIWSSTLDNSSIGDFYWILMEKIFSAVSAIMEQIPNKLIQKTGHCT